MRIKTVIASTLLSLLVAPLQAQTSDNLMDDLIDLTERVRAQSAADRWVVHELDELIAKYKAAGSVTLLADDFGDGDYLNDPAWEAVSGNFYVDSRAVLRSTVIRDQGSAPNAGSEKEGDEQQDIRDSLLSILLEELVDEESQQADSNDPAQQPIARLRIPVSGEGSFTLSADLSVYHESTSEGRFHFDVVGRGGQGLRLMVLTGEETRVAVISLAPSANALLERQILSQALPRYRATRLSMTRDQSGQVTVMAGEETLFSAAGPETSELRRLSISNMQGDWGLERIELSGPAKADQ